MNNEDLDLVLTVAGYLALASLCIWGGMRLDRGSPRSWRRRALVSLIVAIFFAPSVVGGGHGGGPGPAWMALFQMFPVKLGVVPMVTTFAVCFVVSSVVVWLGDWRK